MKSMRIMKAIGVADDELLEAYEKDGQKPVKIRPWVKWCAAAAACLCIAAVGLLTIPGLLQDNTPPAPQLAQDSTDVGAKDAYGPGEAPTQDGVKIVNGAGYALDSSASYRSPEPGQVLYFTEVQAAMEDGANIGAKLFVAIDLFYESGALPGDSTDAAAEIERLQSQGCDVFFAEAWTYEGEGEKMPYTYLAGLFTVEELQQFKPDAACGYAFRFAQNGDGSFVEPNRDGVIDPADYQMNPIPRELTEAEAYAEIGAYLPQAAPDGFVFESSYLTGGEVSVMWTDGGYGELRWTVSDYSDADAARLTSAANTANYDLALYPIPRADSVPEELREIVENPIFDISELTRAVVNMRADNSAEPGDEGVRLRFSVCYGDMLTEVNAKGVSSEWMYESLRALGR